MTSTLSPHYYAYPSYNDIFALNSIMLQQPYGVSGHAVNQDWNYASNHYGESSKSNSDWHPQRNLTYSRKRKRPFTIRAILDLDLGSEEPESNSEDFFVNERAKSLRLSPEPVQMSSARYIQSDESSHHVETVTSSDSYLPNEPARYRLTPPCNESQSTSYSCRTSEESSPSPSKRSKRVRTIFTQHQLEALESEFLRTQYMVGSERVRLAEELSLTESQIKVWFQNRRIKLRKQYHEKQQAALAKLKENQSEERQTESDVDHNSLYSSSISSSCTSSDESQL